MKTERPIRLLGVTQHNLKNISVEFPFRKISVITGLSGSGKSSLAFDTLYAEGQRRYVESLSTYTRQFLEKMPKPEVEGVENIPPAIALEQKNPIVNNRSTVGTQTELLDYLRILYAKVGRTFCIDCQSEVKQINPQTILDWSLNWLPNRKALIVAPLRKISPDKKKFKEKKSARKTSQVPARPDWSLIYPVLREQGFQRILVETSAKNWTFFDLSDLEEKAPPNGQIFIVIDRIRLSSEEPMDSDTRERILDSIEQGLKAGQGRIAFYDLSEDSHLRWKEFQQKFSCVECGREYRLPEPALFSYNNPLGACDCCNGFGFTLDLDENLIVPDSNKSLKNGAVDPFSKPSFSEWQKAFFRFAERHKISIGKRYCDLTQAEKKILWKGVPGDSQFKGILGCFEEMKKWKYKLHIRVFIRRYQSQTLCPICHGSRLKPDALAVKVAGKSIEEVLSLPIVDFLTWAQSDLLSAKDTHIAGEVFQQVKRRLTFLNQVGVGYLTLSRLTKTLSGGEFQRIQLATQLGSGLCGTLYVLDEPSIGLHPTDTQRLIHILEELRDQGNTVVVVEHDLEVMKSADWLIELGPGAGSQGGKVLASGTAQDLIKNSASVTGKYLSGKSRLNRMHPLRPKADQFLHLKGCGANNLKTIEVSFPLHRFVVVTGVSGSGKSTLVHQTLFESLSKLFYHTQSSPGQHTLLTGTEHLSGVALLDQSPIGKSTRSNPATYLKIWEEIRKIFADQPLAQKRGYAARFFSFNTEGGRCPTCEGEGEITIDMHFMAEIQLPCDECQGKRFKKEVLEIKYLGKTIFDILETTIDDAYELFKSIPALEKKLALLKSVGLGYLQLGQSSKTLSGGEAQRLKIAASLDDKKAANLLYIFDEPTTGLHFNDIRKLLDVLQALVDKGHSVIVIEHHVDVVRQADWVVDLGPGGGSEGGQIVGFGTPEELSHNPLSMTGLVLRSLS